MLCIVCSRPIPIPIFENKICNSCASNIKRDDLMKDMCTDADQLEIVQRQLLHDLNLDEDSDYAAELNYLREAKKAAVLNKEKSFSRTEHLKEYSHDHYEEVTTMIIQFIYFFDLI